ncbi:MAG: zf-HC2 domain-containing protein [Desulfobacteraceae bacterium]|nr:zf-HC2 domain-containing protein [Desulfobacteraceae bacterium]
MEKTCAKYTSEDLSRFVDNELPQDKYQTIEKHLSHCPHCSLLYDQYTSISTVFNNHVDQEILKIDPVKLKQNLDQTLKNSQKKSFGNIFEHFGKNIYLKLASIAAILMISLYTFQGGLFSPSGPSAIVKFVDTDFTSVMIIETQKEKHTIIWFSET